MKVKSLSSSFSTVLSPPCPGFRAKKGEEEKRRRGDEEKRRRGDEETRRRGEEVKNKSW
jgi:hypothetical protein